MQNNLVGEIFFVLPKVTLVNCSKCKEERQLSIIFLQQPGLYVHNSRRVNLNPHGKNTSRYYYKHKSVH